MSFRTCEKCSTRYKLDKHKPRSLTTAPFSLLSFVNLFNDNEHMNWKKKKKKEKEKKYKIRIHSHFDQIQVLSFTYPLVSSTTFDQTFAIFSAYPTYSFTNKLS